MAFIDTAAHEKFKRLYQSLMTDTDHTSALNGDESLNILKADMERMEKIVNEYKNVKAELTSLSIQYDQLLHRAKVNMRRQMRIIKSFRMSK